MLGFLFFGIHPIFSQQYSKTQLQKMYSDYLKSEGYSPSVDEDGDVAFKYEGGNYYILVDENDLECFQILFPGFWEIESRAERTDAAIAASVVNRTTKVVKVWLTPDNDDVSISGEVFLKSPADFSGIFKRLLSAMTTARRDFIKEME
jgi:hypothetical protein